MGISKSKVAELPESHSAEKVLKASGKTQVPPEVYLAHYTPSTFPLTPVLKPDFLPLCRKSWQVIVAQREKHPEYGTDIHGITAFYNEFYERLGKVDSNSLFESILVKHAVGTNRIAAKGAILVRIVDYLLRIDGDTPDTRANLRALGYSHKNKGIRPWQYSVFLELFILTLGSRLKDHATPSVMEAWVNLLGFSLRHMLPTSIEGLVLESEAHVNFVLAAEDNDISNRNTTVSPGYLFTSDSMMNTLKTTGECRLPSIADA